MPPGTSIVTPIRPWVSAASARVKPTTPNLEAQYAVASLSARRPSVDATVTTRPRRSSRSGIAARTTADRAEQVDHDDPVPVLAGHVVEAAAGVGAGAGDDGVEAAHPLRHRADRGLGGAGVGEVDELLLDVEVGRHAVEDHRRGRRRRRTAWPRRRRSPEAPPVTSDGAECGHAS